MNPIKWQKEQQVGLLLFVFIGSFVGYVIRYESIGGRLSLQGFYNLYYSGIPTWIFGGGILGGSLAYATKLLFSK